jgi:ADP-heptose:LPS heptosyltransferase
VAIQYHHLVEALWADPREIPVLKTPARHPEDGGYQPPLFEPTPQEVQTVRELLAAIAGHPIEGPILLLNPNTSDLLPLRRWETERFVQLGRRLLVEHPGSLVAITGAPSERQGAEQVAARIGPPDRCVCTAGHTTLRQLMVLYSIADVLVTNDSGPGHFASMTELPTVVLFGPETPRLFGPLGLHTHVIWKDLACSPCVNAMNHRFSPCNNNVCMQQITVEDVLARVNELLLRRSAAHRKALAVLS